MIRIGMDPNIIDAGGFVLSWHGFFTFVAVAVAVVLVAARWARREGIESDLVYAIAVWAVVAGIIGARIVHVVDRWEYYSQNMGQVFSVWQGGIGLWGAILFGFLGGAGYIYVRKVLGRIYRGETMRWVKNLVPAAVQQGYLNGAMYTRFKDFSIGRMADIAAPGLLIAQTIGRLGDIVNGEHVATRTDLPWGFVYSYPSSLSYQQWGLNASHPAVAYEMIWNMLVLAVVWKLRGRLAPPGMIFTLYLMLYALGRFFIQFVRLDKVWFAGLQEAHIIALLVLAVTVPILAYKARWVKPTPAPQSQPPAPRRARAKS